MQRFHAREWAVLDTVARQISDSLGHKGDNYPSQVAARFAVTERMAQIALAKAWLHLAANATGDAVGLEDDQRSALERAFENSLADVAFDDRVS